MENQTIKFKFLHDLNNLNYGKRQYDRESYEKALNEYLERGAYVTIATCESNNLSRYTMVNPENIVGRIKEIDKNENSATVEIFSDNFEYLTKIQNTMGLSMRGICISAYDNNPTTIRHINSFEICCPINIDKKGE